MRTLLLVLLTSRPCRHLRKARLAFPGGNCRWAWSRTKPATIAAGCARSSMSMAGPSCTARSAPSPDTSVEARAGVGWGDVDGLDYIFAGGAIAHRLTLSLGTSGGTDPHTRPFRTADPVAPLVRRGFW